MRVLLMLIAIVYLIGVYGQTRSNSNDLEVLKGGKYYSKSVSYNIKGASLIEPQLLVDSLHAAIGFLEITGERLTLFKNAKPTGKEDVAGILTKNSIVEICNIDHRAVYGDMGTPTHDIWYTIDLNGRQYYIDVQPASLIYKQDYPAENQVFAVFAKYSGYDWNYTNSYPENFRVVVFDNQSPKIKIWFDSKELKFKNGNEFWAAHNNADLITKITDKGLEFELVGFEQRYTATWNGQKLVNIKVVDVPN